MNERRPYLHVLKRGSGSGQKYRDADSEPYVRHFRGAQGSDFFIYRLRQNLSELRGLLKKSNCMEVSFFWRYKYSENWTAEEVEFKLWLPSTYPLHLPLKLTL
ncbi:hypothetical protein NPIL_321491 [Nephila pilipes]|uniref:Uncharacterized protein n=1 Tax=Nephila pilipes TaxID=299642 RepID=A0A8X6TUI1_NEPPI|nr:hypothetical protein NPIL_321491 [Nephila pilipes]